jgi:hypothetical protein
MLSPGDRFHQQRLLPCSDTGNGSSNPDRGRPFELRLLCCQDKGRRRNPQPTCREHSLWTGTLASYIMGSGGPVLRLA